MTTSTMTEKDLSVMTVGEAETGKYMRDNKLKCENMECDQELTLYEYIRRMKMFGFGVCGKHLIELYEIVKNPNQDDWILEGENK